MALVTVDPKALEANPFECFDDEWALLTAGGEAGFNTMTVSWGAMGTLWSRSAATVYVRPERFTHQFMEAAERFTVSFYGPQAKRALGVLGTRSGRDCDKVSEVGFVPVHPAPDVTAFEGARLVIVCRKLYVQRLDSEHLVKKNIDSEFYDEEGYHDMYVGEVEQVLVAD